MNEFNELSKVNVNSFTEKKNGLTYLSWPNAWAETVKRFPKADYKIKTWNEVPYHYDPSLGYMVMTSVSLDGWETSKTMWLPVMDGANKAMKAEAYKVKTKYKELEVQPATMFDINTAIMRCLVKNLAMFGLGLYIYAGEDLPEEEEKNPKKTEPAEDKMKAAYPPRAEMEKTVEEALSDEELKKTLAWAEVKSLKDMPEAKLAACYNQAMKRRTK